MRRWLTAVVAVSMLAAAAPAMGDHGGIHPTFAESRVYFQCVGGDPMKVQNTSTPIPWSDQAPNSVQGGAGCGFLDTQAMANEDPSGGEFDPVFAGDVAGNLTNLTVEAWMLGQHHDGTVFGDFPVRVRLRVDGTDVFNGDEEIVTFLETSETGASQRIEFTFTRLDKYFATEDGDGEQVRHIEITITPWYTESVYASWVWGSSEVPAGVTFNDATPAPNRYIIP